MGPSAQTAPKCAGRYKPDGPRQTHVSNHQRTAGAEVTHDEDTEKTHVARKTDTPSETMNEITLAKKTTRSSCRGRKPRVKRGERVKKSQREKSGKRNAEKSTTSPNDGAAELDGSAISQRINDVAKAEVTDSVKHPKLNQTAKRVLDLLEVDAQEDDSGIGDDKQSNADDSVQDDNDKDTSDILSVARRKIATHSKSNLFMDFLTDNVWPLIENLLSDTEAIAEDVEFVLSILFTMLQDVIIAHVDDKSVWGKILQSNFVLENLVSRRGAKSVSSAVKYGVIVLSNVVRNARQKQLHSRVAVESILNDEESLQQILDLIPAEKRCTFEQARLLLQESDDDASRPLCKTGMDGHVNTLTNEVLVRDNNTNRLLAFVKCMKHMNRITADNYKSANNYDLDFDELLQQCNGYRDGADSALRSFNTVVSVTGLDVDTSGDEVTLSIASTGTVVAQGPKTNAAPAENSWLIFRHVVFNRGTIFIMNHRSIVEGFALTSVVGKLSVVIGSNISKFPVMGELLLGIGYLSVPSDNPRAVHDSIDELLSRGVNILIFPEAMTHAGKMVSNFSIMPFTHACTYQVVSNRSNVHVGTRPGEWKTYINRLLQQDDEGHIEFVFHEPIDNTQLQHDAQDLADTCQRMIADELQIPIHNDITRVHATSLYDAILAHTN